MTARNPDQPHPPDPEFVKALEDGGLLQDEYPDQMAARSCTCTQDAVCGAHRLLTRYEQLFAAFQESNREKRARRATVVAQATQLAAAHAAIRWITDGGPETPEIVAAIRQARGMGVEE